MKRWMLTTLGGSDIQYLSDANKPPEERRFKHYSNECKELYSYLQETGDSNDLSVPLIQSLAGTLLQRGAPPDHLILLYTLQEASLGKEDSNPGMKKDTYWAFRIIQYLAEKTDYFGVRFTVTGIRINGNPSSHEEMVYLYKQFMTSENLRTLGLSENDELYCSFTAGTPAMTQYLMLGFSTLYYPKHRECFYTPMGNKTAHQLPLVELLRHDDVFMLLNEMMRSMQFTAAIRLLDTTSFTFLSSCQQEIGLWIQVMHHRYLFCFDDALEKLKRCRSVFANEPFFKRMEQDLQKLSKGMKKLEHLTAASVRDPDILALVSEYYQKVLFFWNSKQWNEFAFIAGSFYEWILQISFLDQLGFSLAQLNSERKEWYRFLGNQSRNPQLPVELVSFAQQASTNRQTKSNRICYIDSLKRFPACRSMIHSDWRHRMDSLYSQIRNAGVHQLRGADESEIIGILGSDWPKATRKVLKEHFMLEPITPTFQQSIDDFYAFLNRCFYNEYVRPLDTEEEINWVH